MVKYEDYFPKTMLNKCGIKPESKLIGEEEFSTLTANKNEGNICQLINNIYGGFKSASVKNGTSEKSFKEFNVNRRIVAMLCDLDVISDIEKEKYLFNADQKALENGFINDNETRVRIELPELDALSANKLTEKSEKVVSKNELKTEFIGRQK